MNTFNDDMNLDTQDKVTRAISEATELLKEQVEDVSKTQRKLQILVNQLNLLTRVLTKAPNFHEDPTKWQWGGEGI